MLSRLLSVEAQAAAGSSFLSERGGGGIQQRRCYNSNMIQKSPAQPNQSLAHGLECLYQLVSADCPVGCREMARGMGMERTRVNRLLGTLAHLGLAERTSDRKYLPGPGLHVLAAMSMRGSGLLTHALPHIRRLSDETGLKVALGVLWRRHVCYLYHGGGGREVEAAILGSNLVCAEKSSIGKVLLAALDKDDIKSRFAGSPIGESNRDFAALWKELKEVRRQGFALSWDSTSLAVPLESSMEASIAVISGATRQPQALLNPLREAASRIALDMNKEM